MNDTKELKFDLAVFQHIRFGFLYVTDASLENDGDYARISESQEILFKPLEQEEVISNRIAAVDVSIKTIMTEALKKIEVIKQERPN